MKRPIHYIAVIGILGLAGMQTLNAQIKEEKLILDRKREPEVKKIEKKKTSVAAEKNYPPKEKAKDSLKYQITDIPVVSDFKTSTIKGEDISPKFNTDYNRNYFQIGYGNYGKFLVDGNVSGQIEKNLEVGADVHHISTSGLKKYYDWDSKQQNTAANVYLNSYGETGKLNIDVGMDLNTVNYYGNYQDVLKPANNADLKQTFNTFGANAYYDFYANNYLNDARAKMSFTKDHFGASENFYDFSLNLAKHDLNINSDSGITINADMGLGIKSVNTTFDILDKNASKHFAANITPALTFFKDNHYLKIGSKFTVLNSRYSDANTAETKNNKTYWFPTAEILIAPKDEVKFYAGVDGGIEFNTYNNMLHENPFLVSDLQLRPTETKYHFYFGVKGDIDQNFKYDLSGGYSKLNNMMFYRSNGLFSTDPSAARNAYDYLNTFGVVYDNGNLTQVKASAEYFPMENLNFSGELKYMSYSLNTMKDAFYKPVIQATLGAKYSMLNKKLNFGFKGIIVTDRKGNAFDITNAGVTPAMPLVTNETTDKKIPGYIDLNLSAEYKVHKNVSLFIMGNNLTGKSYQNYLGYKVLGAQVLGGVKLEF